MKYNADLAMRAIAGKLLGGENPYHLDDGKVYARFDSIEFGSDKITLVYRNQEVATLPVGVSPGTTLILASIEARARVEFIAS